MNCDKMISRRILTLPGDLQLPAAVLIETYAPYETDEARLDSDRAAEQLTDYAVNAALADMQAGQILGHNAFLSLDGGAYHLKSVLECHEMIAETVEAKWNEEDLNDDGTHSQRGTVGADH